MPALSVDQYGPCGTPPNPTETLFEASADVFIDAVAGFVAMELIELQVGLLELQNDTKACGECLDTYMVDDFNNCNSSASTPEDVGACLGNATLGFYDSCMPLVPTSDSCTVLEFTKIALECAELGDDDSAAVFCLFQGVKNITDPTCGMCFIHNLVQQANSDDEIDTVEEFFCVPTYDSVMYSCSQDMVNAWTSRASLCNATDLNLASLDCLFDPVQPDDCQDCLLYASFAAAENNDDGRRSLAEEELFYAGCLESNAPTTPTAPTIPVTPTTPTMPTIPAPTAPAAAPTNPSSSATKSILAMAVGAITIIASVVVVA